MIGMSSERPQRKTGPYTSIDPRLWRRPAAQLEYQSWGKVTLGRRERDVLAWLAVAAEGRDGISVLFSSEWIARPGALSPASERACISRALANLERRGLVQRTIRDGRTVTVCLTQGGAYIAGRLNLRARLPSVAAVHVPRLQEAEFEELPVDVELEE